MWRAMISLFVLIFLVTSFIIASAAPQAASRDDALVRRGKYLAHDVAMCVQCHTPHNADGALDLQRLLTGAPIPIDSPYPKQVWAFRAPPLAGLPGGWTEAQLAKFLQTGETPNGHGVRPPMPPFRLNAEDARSVAAYLRSLRQ